MFRLKCRLLEATTLLSRYNHKNWIRCLKSKGRCRDPRPASAAWALPLLYYVAAISDTLFRLMWMWVKAMCGRVGERVSAGSSSSGPWDKTEALAPLFPCSKQLGFTIGHLCNIMTTNFLTTHHIRPEGGSSREVGVLGCRTSRRCLCI